VFAALAACGLLGRLWKFLASIRISARCNDSPRLQGAARRLLSGRTPVLSSRSFRRARRLAHRRSHHLGHALAVLDPSFKAAQAETHAKTLAIRPDSTSHMV
jgi:hypothetical protein